jgi:hypothetical protein
MVEQDVRGELKARARLRMLSRLMLILTGSPSFQADQAANRVGNGWLRLCFCRVGIFVSVQNVTKWSKPAHFASMLEIPVLRYFCVNEDQAQRRLFRPMINAQPTCGPTVKREGKKKQTGGKVMLTEHNKLQFISLFLCVFFWVY